MNWKNPDLPREARLDDLMERLSLDEKISLLDNDAPGIDRLDLPPFKYGGEALHGLCNTGRATLFPMPIGLAATFDPDLIGKIASATGDEMRAKYHASEWRNARGVTLLVFSPVINIYRDPRWGRGQETYGEDPLLTGQLGAAFVRGIQGDHPEYLKLAACAKHLGVHSGPEALRQKFNAVVSKEDLYETYLPAFEALVRAGARTVMATYNRVNGEHCCAHSEMIGEFLRDKLGFDGVILSDGGALSSLHRKPAEPAQASDAPSGDGVRFADGHNLTEDLVETAGLCLREQCDLELGRHAYHLAGEAIKRGLISEYEVDRAVRRILRLRFELGEYDSIEYNPYAQIPLSVIQSEEHVELARQAAQKSIVLLENRDAALPLQAERDHTVLVTGPTSTDLQILLGNFYRGSSGRLVSLLEGITAEAPEGVVINSSQACFLNHPNAYDSDWFLGHADTSTTVIACVGFSPLMEGEQGECIGAPDGGDKSSIALPDNQLDFLRKLRTRIDENGGTTRLIVVVTGGGPLELTEVAEMADALLFAWYPGQEGGTAIAQTLWGKCDPSGKLPVTFPKKLEDLPPYADYSMDGRSYRFMEARHIHYPFGYGLSYTKFTIGNVSVDTREGAHFAEVEVTNAGDRDGETVLQIYAQTKRNAQPSLKLVGFQRIHLRAGHSEKPTLTLHNLPSPCDGFIAREGSTGLEAETQSVACKL